MKPTEICSSLGAAKIDAILAELTAPQVKTVLKQGDLRVKLPSGYLSQQKRRQLWSGKIQSGLVEGNQPLAAELLQQWLLNHRRPMLAGFLDQLGVRHRQGETDESFLIARSAEKIRAAASWLLETHDRQEVLAYLRYIAYQQRSAVFDGWEGETADTAAAPAPVPAAAPAGDQTPSPPAASGAPPQDPAVS